ncbi:MAG: MOSC domain-containing protein [Chloroflexi bacterium]|nr:MOSC domain-containing protein [Chloroflexota bacterium]
MIQLSSLIYYPIKSCRGIEITSTRIERMGLANDRRMMVTTVEGEFLTQREHPKLALVSPEFIGRTVRLSAPGYDTIDIPLKLDDPVKPVQIWKSKNVHAIDQGTQAAEWFSNFLEAQVRLVHFAPEFRRTVNPEFAVRPDDHTAFADGYPILILSEESLNDLNSRLEIPLPMDRFRPNVVVKGTDPYREDTWKRIRLGSVEMAIVKPCPRCVVTTIDKQTLATNPEPLRTLNRYRKQAGGAMFGQNAIPLGEGILEVGMPVEVIK